MKTLTESVLSKNVLQERDIGLIRKRLSSGEKVKLEKPYLLTKDQEKKGLSWLMKKHISPTGRVRRSSPFTKKEENVIKNFKRFELVDFKKASDGTPMPVYRVVGAHDSFKYFGDYARVKILA